MPTLLRLISAISLIWLSATSAFSQDARMTPELLWKLGRLGEATISADGTQIAYSVRRFELEKNQGATTLYLLDWESGEQEVLLENWPGVGDLQFVGQGDEERLYFTGRPTEEIAQQQAKELGISNSNGADADAEDSQAKPVWPQIWSIEMATGDRKQLSQLDQPVANLKVSPTGTHVAFTLRIQLDPETRDIFPDLPLADAKIIDGLMFRHWDGWHDGKYSHLHVAELDAAGMVGTPRDLMRGIRADTPLPPFGGSRQIAWAPSGDEIAYTAKIVNNWAQSTDSSIFVCHLGEDEVTTQCITTGMEGYDVEPLYSPDQRWIAFHSMERPGFESDRNRILLYSRSTGELQELTVGLDQTTHRATWLPDSSGMVFYSERLGTDQIFRIDLGRQGATQITSGQKNWSIVDVMPDGENLLVSVQDMIRPSELALVSLADGDARRITGINDSLYEDLELPTVQQRWVRSSDGAMVHCWVIYPPDFDPQRQWPLLTYCQGGPQGQIGQWFSYRWNFHLMASQGYVVLAPNRRGLPGFGRDWNDQISGDWGGQAMQDILATTDEMLRQPYIDERRAAAVGASFGGYTVYWLMGHHQDRFRTMIAHCGVFNLESMYGSTEELFFVDWDMGGPYWKNAELQRKYDEFSPHRFVRDWKTPLLVIHGEKDFRVPLTQGIEAFTAAQVQGVPSRFLYFPNEGHWVQTPQNGVLWHRVFFDWLGRYLDETPVVRSAED